MRKLLALVFCLAMVILNGCSVDDAHSVPGSSQDNLIVVGFSQVGAESEWRVANTENIKSVFSEENGYMLFFDDARQEQENQIRAIGCLFSRTSTISCFPQK